MFITKVVSSYSGMPKEAKYLTLASVMPSLAYGLLYTDISYFLTFVQGVPAEFMGIVIAVMGVATFVASMFLGVAADIYGRKNMLIIGNVLASVTLSVFAITTNPLLLLAAAILQGISEAAILASSSALLAEKVDNEKRNSAFSLYSFAQSFAFGVGGFVISAVLVFEHVGFTEAESHIILYVLVSVTSLASTILMLKVKESKRPKKTKTTISDLLPTKSRDVLIKYIITGAIVAFGAGLVVPLMTYWFSVRYGISDKISGPLVAVSSLLIAFATLVAPVLAKKFGLIKAIVITQTVSTVFMFATPIPASFAWAGVVYSIRALLMNMSSPLSQSMIMGLVAEDERGAASGISGALWRLPNALSTGAGAWLMGIGLLHEPFYLAGVLYIVSIALFWIYFRKVRMPEEEPLAVRTRPKLALK